VLTLDEAQRLIDKDPRNKDVLFPYLNGEDLNSRPDQSPSRWVINFFDWPLDRESAPEDYDGPVASDYSHCMSIVREKVKPFRSGLKRKNYREQWWRFGERCPGLYRTIAGMERVLVKSEVGNKLSFEVVVNDKVFSHMLIVFSMAGCNALSVLQSSMHEVWARQYGSSMRTDLRYTPSDCFETFALPSDSNSLIAIGQTYRDHRRQIMLSRQEGLTITYNRFHDPDESAADIQKLRDLHVEMDRAVAAAYGWDDLDLGHGFHETKQGTRFTISEPARREVLARLLKLNHERYAEEVAQGLHDKKGKGKAKTPKAGRGRKSKASSGGTLPFGDDDDDPDPSDSDPSPAPERAASRPARSDLHIQQPHVAEPAHRPTPIDEIETDAIMAAFRQAARGRGWLDRDELLKEVSLVLGYQRLGPKIEEALRGHLRAAIRRRIIETDGPDLVRAGTGTMADYDLDELRETFRSVMRKGTSYEREDVIHALARHLGFVRVTETIRQPIKSAINSAIRHGLLGYEGSVIWRED
jgi:hypothetical protein